MRAFNAVMLVAVTAGVLCVSPAVGQETAVADAKRAMSRVKMELEKVVVFREAEDGGGAFLKAEYDRAEHLKELERRAVRAGDERKNAAKYDLAKRLDAFPEKYSEEAFQAFAAYVGFVKAAREYAEQIKQDEEFDEKVTRIIEDLDVLIDRHGRDLRIESLKLLYEDDPTGKVGAYNLRGAARKVVIDGQEAAVYELKTLEGFVVVLKKEGAKQRKRFVLAEIVSKGECRTDSGEALNAVVLRGY